ncbi:MAG: cupin domain-containing protein [Pseudomonadota bacterium]
MTPTNKDRAEHYIWGDACDGWRLLDRSSLSVIEERMPKGTSENTHFHNAAHQMFYVLDGTLSIKVEGKTREPMIGDALHIPLQTVHKVMNKSRADVRFLVISSPRASDDRVQS